MPGPMDNDFWSTMQGFATNVSTLVQGVGTAATNVRDTVTNFKTTANPGGNITTGPNNQFPGTSGQYPQAERAGALPAPLYTRLNNLFGSSTTSNTMWIVIAVLLALVFFGKRLIGR